MAGWEARSRETREATLRRHRKKVKGQPNQFLFSLEKLLVKFHTEIGVLGTPKEEQKYEGHWDAIGSSIA